MSVQEICVVVVVADSCQAVVLDNAKKLQSVSQHHFIQFFFFLILLAKASHLNTGFPNEEVRAAVLVSRMTA